MTRTLLDALDTAARTSRGFHFPGEKLRLTYAELRAAAERIGSALAERYEAGRPVLIVLPNGSAAVTAFYAALHAGLVPSVLPLPRPFADIKRYLEGLARIARIADDAPVIAAAPVPALLASSPTTQHLTVLDPTALDAAPTAPRHHGVALIQFTSGSIGDPKGVVLSHDAVLGNGEAIARRLDATAHDVGCYWVPLAHDMGLIGSLVFLLGEGADQVLMTTEQFALDPGEWLRVSARHGATLLSGPPFAFDLAARRLLKDAARGVPLPDLSAIRHCVIGAEPIDARILRRVNATLAECGFTPDPWVAAYGLAEYACVASIAKGLKTTRVKSANAIGEPVGAADEGVELVSCGRPLDGAEVRIVDEAGSIVGDRVAGRVEVAGRSAMVGYWRDLERSTAAFSGSWVKTGDIGFLADGDLYISGREKDVIIVRGRHFFPEEIEAVALDVPGVRTGGVIAFGVVDPSGGTERVFVVVETGKDTDVPALERALRQAIADRLDLYVHAVVPVPQRSVPRTASGKPRRGEARQRWGAGSV